MCGQSVFDHLKPLAPNVINTFSVNQTQAEQENITQTKKVIQEPTKHLKANYFWMQS